MPLLILALGAACAPAAPAPTAESTPPPGPAVEPASSQTAPVSPAPAPTATSPGAGFDPAGAGGTDAPIPELSWDLSDPRPLISGTFCCGFTSAEYVRNYVPEFQIWGDGRYIWVAHAEDGSRAVMESRLGAGDPSGILSRAA